MRRVTKTRVHFQPKAVPGSSDFAGRAELRLRFVAEPAVWALQGMGVRCVVAPSFGDIFEANCHQNGLLPITLPEDQMDELAAIADTGALVTVDLADQLIVAAEHRWSFTIGSMQKLALLEGLDDIDLALRAGDDVDAWQTRDRAARPWAWTTTRPDRNPAQ